MIDLEKTLVKIVLALVAILFVVLLFNSCKSHNDIVKTHIDSTATEVVKVESHTTDNSTTQEDYTEVTYVLDSGQIVTIGHDIESVTNCNQLRVSQIKIKNSHVTSENKIDNKIYATEEKTAEIKEKSTQIEKTKTNTTRNLRLVAVLFVSIVILLALWRFYQKLN